MKLFHYHLVTSDVRDVEARYLGKLGFRLVARYGRIGEDQMHFEAGISWEELEQKGFRHRLSELERGAVNVVVQPGQWPMPRVDHLGVALDDDQFQDVLERATRHRLRVQEYPGRRTFIATDAGYRLEIHPQRDWIDELLENAGELRLEELHLRADDPSAKADALSGLLEVEQWDGQVVLGGTTVRFLPEGPRGRPELHAEVFDRADF
ncbi:MAG TPA: VOC family protein [Gaiellaceae bacterium]|nr:VOC family protein [Gaiellaceae bacterium]